MSEKWQDCPHGSCRLNHRCVYIPCWDTMTTTQPPNPSLEELLAFMRQQGWLVAVHNDYRHNGTYTFWLFTNKESGRFVKGEAEDDLTAVQQCLDQVRLLTAKAKMMAERRDLLVEGIAAQLRVDRGVSWHRIPEIEREHYRGKARAYIREHRSMLAPNAQE